MFYFRDVEIVYGRVIKNYVSKWIKGVLRILILREQLTFLLRCKKSNIFPLHIENKFLNSFHRSYSRSVTHELQKSIFFFKSRLLNFEIRDLNCEIYNLNIYLKNLKFFLVRNFEHNDWYELSCNQEKHFNKIKYSKRSKLKRKFEYLRIKKHSRGVGINNGAWFKNLTDKVIPNEVVNIMSKGAKFGMPYLKKELPVKEIIADVESNMCHFEEEFKKKCRSSLVKVISNFKKENKFDNYLNSNLFHEFKVTKKFLIDNPNIIFQKADKGNITVASNKVEYINHIKLILNDDTTYKKIRNPHINKLQVNLKGLLLHWKSKDYIDSKIFNYLKCENGTVAKCYGLPKIHKTQLTYRIIISSINFPTYKLSRFLSDILVNVVGKTSSYIKDSWSFYENIKDIVIPNNYKMISLDVVALFTNVPLDFLNEIINEKWFEISLYCKLTKDEFLKALDLVFKNTFFSFDNEFYEQSYGCPMGSPLSPVVANLVMEKIEGIALSKLSFEPIIYKRYVDDIFMIVPEEFVDEMVDVFNSIHYRIKFTVELEVENKLSFLDIQINKDNNGVKLNWYRKPTWSGRFLNFDSHHQFGNKIGTLKGVIDRAIKLSHGDFRKENLKLVKDTFINNNYPGDFVDKIVKERIEEIYNSDWKNKCKTVVNRRELIFVLPYVKGLSERIRREFKNHNIQIFFKNTNNISRFFSNCKDKDEKDYKSGLVYKINCKDCDKCYVGQTGRYLKKRVYEHRYSLRSDSIDSGLKKHCLDNLHSFDFENVDILEQNVNNKYKRLSLENIHIFKNKNNVNLIKESSKLDSIYHPFLN